MTALELTCLLIIAVLVPAALWLVRRRGTGAVPAAALPTCATLLRLLAQLQQHRGLASGWLSGDESFAARMHARRAEIDALLATLAPLVRDEERHPRPCFNSNDLMLFRHHWRELVDSLAVGGVEQSIARHTRLIARVLDWLAAIGEARIELPTGHRLPAGQVRNYTHRLPALAECLGQARALGSSVAVQRRCPAVARVRLMFLMARAETLLDQTGSDNSLAAQTSETVRRLVATVRTDMLGAAGVSLTAEAYFAQATQTIDAVFDWAGDCARDIERLLAGNVVVAGAAQVAG